MLQLPAGQGAEVPASLLNVQIKVDTDWFKDMPEDRVYTLPKLLIARVKGTSLL